MRVVTSDSTWVDVGPFGWAPANMFTIPWLAIGGVTWGIPLLVGAVTALVVRSAPPMAPRRT